MKEEALDPSIAKIIRDYDKPFKEACPFEERFLEFQVIRCNYPGVLPISCEIQNYTGAKRVGFRLYVSDDILAGHFKAFIKKLLMLRYTEMGRSDSLLLMVDDDVIVKQDVQLKQIYKQKAEEDGWLHLKISVEA